MKIENPSWTEMAVFICTRCQKSWTQNQVPSDTAYAETLKNKYKSELNQMGFKGKVRVMTSGCLGECPIEKQAITVFEPKTIGSDVTFVMTPVDDENLVLNEIKQKLSR